MVSKLLFPVKSPVVVPLTTNQAGGKAYSMSNEHALCQFVVTGTFNGTYYANSEDQLAEVKKLVDSVNPNTIAKAAIYGFEVAKMKDLPAYLTAVLAAKGELELLKKVFPRVIKNIKMLCNFVQIIRSGVLGRKSFGTAVKRLIVEFLKSRSPDDLFKQHFGHANPSVKDIIKMVHPKPNTKAEELTYAYLLDKEIKNKRYLPKLIKQFETFKVDNTAELPDLDYRSLSNCNLTVDHWRQIAENMPWNMLRMNLNKLQKEGVFNNKTALKNVVNKLKDKELVKKFNVFPYQLMTAFQNMDDSIPTEIRLALQDALDAATENVPELGDDVAVLVDVSGSMGHAITGNRGSVTSKTRCVDVAALIASSVLRKNPNAWIVQFDTIARRLNLNPRDSVMSNAQNIAARGGGTDVSCGLNFIRKSGCKAKTVIIVSDNESWFNQSTYRRYGTKSQQEWNTYSTVDAPGAKLICIDLIPNSTAQVKDSSKVLNIGGFTDSVFEVIHNFVYNSSEHFVDVVNKVKL